MLIGSSAQSKKKKLTVIGAGPIGIEAAIRGVQKGWDVTVYEKEQVGAHLQKWGHIRFFTPVKDNVSKTLWDAIAQKPNEEDFLTGQEYVEKVLRPIAETGPLKGKVKEGVKVRSVSKRRMVKTELPGHPLRADRPFQLLVEDKNGKTEIVESHFVMDASGVFGYPNWSGESGLPAPGEDTLNGHINRHLPDLLGKDKKDWIGKKVLLIGDGHSAATAMAWFGELQKQDPNTHVHWVVLTDRARPCVEVADDPLPERKSTVKKSNDLAQNPPDGWKVHRKMFLRSVKPFDDGSVEAVIGRGSNNETIKVQKILSMTGYRPDTSLVEELQVELSPVTGGAGRLAKSLMSIKDCLAKVNVPNENLESGEKGFYLIGHKSYGRLNTFLLRSGLEQLDQIFSQLN